MKRTYRWLLALLALIGLAYVGLRCVVLISPCIYVLGFTPMGLYSGSPVAPSQHLKIKLESQDVTIRLLQREYIVDAVYDFFNSGKTTTQWVRFPKRGTSWNGDCLRSVDFIRFDAWVDGSKVELSEERDLYADTKFLIHALRGRQVGTDYNAWLGCQVKFPARARTTVRVSYEASYLSQYRGRAVPYLVGTASSWQGTIERTVFTIDGSEIGGKERLSLGLLSPPWRRLISENVIRMEIKRF